MAIIKKRIIENQPKFGNKSLYNFSEGYDNEDTIYNDSTSLPLRNDKFQNKDLFTNSVSSDLNEKIIEKNLKYEGSNFVTINNLFISNTGADGTVKNNSCIIWMFSETAYKNIGGINPVTDGYNKLKSLLINNTTFRIFSGGRGNAGQGTDWGNIEPIENVPIVSDFGLTSQQVVNGALDFPGGAGFLPEGPDTELEFNQGGAFQLNNTEQEDSLSQKLFNEDADNPIYIVVYTRGDKM